MTNNINTLNEQRLSELAKKYNLVNYTPGQSFDSIKDSMTKEDYDVSQKLLDYYLNQQNLNNDYKNNMNQINQNQSKLLQENAISKEMSSKYLPEYLKLQGLNGLGVSESSALAMRNNYINNRNTINSSIDLQKADLLKNYQTNMNNLDQSALSDVDAIRNKYQLQKDNEELEKYESYLSMLNNKEFNSEEDLQKWYDGIKGNLSEDRESILANKVENYKQNLETEKVEDTYKHFLEKIDYGEFNTTEELENSYNSIKDILSESQKSLIEDRINYYKNNPEQQKIDEEVKRKEVVESVMSGNKYIQYSGKNYRIKDTKPLDSSDSILEMLNDAWSYIPINSHDKGKDIYDAKEGISLSYSDIHRAWNRKHHGSEYNEEPDTIEDLKEFDALNLNITFFNGEWYLSSLKKY